MKKYEYMTVKQSYLLDWKAKRNPVNCLNEYGREGWALVSEFNAGRELIFMREFEKPPLPGKRSFSGSLSK